MCCIQGNQPTRKSWPNIARVSLPDGRYPEAQLTPSLSFSLSLLLSLSLSFSHSLFLPLHRLRCLVKQLDKGEVNVVDLRKNIEYAASVLEAVYIDETR